jgi:hypothetical protein
VGCDPVVDLAQVHENILRYLKREGTKTSDNKEDDSILSGKFAVTIGYLT